jgi:hypothetical protein
MKNYATAAGFLDVVGIKLGMTPAQVTAAIKVYDPSYKFWVVNSRLETPSKPGFTPVPRFIYAHSPAMTSAQGQLETITIQFTTPPNRPVVQEVERYVAFHVGEPVLASNLLGNFRKKYGQENSGTPGAPTWVYDSNGKLLTQVPGLALSCQPTENISSVIVGGDPTHDAQDGGLTLANTVTDTNGSNAASNCLPYVYVRALGVGLNPSDQVVQMRVSIRSGALAYSSIKATHNWLQADADGKAKQQQDAARQRTGPKL